MVKLANADPNPPKAGENFEIKAREGAGPYTFVYKIGLGDAVTVNQAGDTLTIPIPANAANKSLTVTVVDSTQSGDAWIGRIVAP